MEKDTPTEKGNRSDMAYRFKFEHRMTDSEIQKGQNIINILDGLSYGDSKVILQYALYQIETSSVIKI
jgi:hypothetical protein